MHASTRLQEPLEGIITGSLRRVDDREVNNGYPHSLEVGEATCIEFQKSKSCSRCSHHKQEVAKTFLSDFEVLSTCFQTPCVYN